MVCKVRLDGYSCFDDALTAISLHSRRFLPVRYLGETDDIDRRMHSKRGHRTPRELMFGSLMSCDAGKESRDNNTLPSLAGRVSIEAQVLRVDSHGDLCSNPPWVSRGHCAIGAVLVGPPVTRSIHVNAPHRAIRILAFALLYHSYERSSLAPRLLLSQAYISR
jgi:hypothetical protein